MDWFICFRISCRVRYILNQVSSSGECKDSDKTNKQTNQDVLKVYTASKQ